MLLELFLLLLMLVAEGGAAEELAEKGCRRDYMLADRAEIAEEFAQSIGLAVFGDVMGDGFKHFLGAMAHDPKLKDEGGIEGGVGVFLIGKNPFFLAPSDRRPSANSLHGVGASILVVADDATEESIVGSGNPVVVIDSERGESRDVDAIFEAVVNTVGKLGIEAVDAFDEEDGVFVESKGVSAIFTGSELKIIGWHVDGLAGYESAQMVVKEFEVESVERFVVIVASLIFRGEFTVNEVVVKRNHPWLQKVGHQIDGEALGEGSLAGGGWPRHHNDTRATLFVATSDFISDA